METYFIYNMSFMMFLGLRFYSYVNMHALDLLWNFEHFSWSILFTMI